MKTSIMNSLSKMQLGIWQKEDSGARSISYFNLYFGNFGILGLQYEESHQTLMIDETSPKTKLLIETSMEKSSWCFGSNVNWDIEISQN